MDVVKINKDTSSYDSLFGKIASTANVSHVDPVSGKTIVRVKVDEVVEGGRLGNSVQLFIPCEACHDNVVKALDTSTYVFSTGERKRIMSVHDQTFHAESLVLERARFARR